MKSNLSIKKPLLLALVLALGLMSSGRIANGAERTCYEDWSAAGKHIEREELVSVTDIRKLVGKKLAGSLIKIRLCTEADRYLYQLVMFAPNGKVSKLDVDAKEPEFK